MGWYARPIPWELIDSVEYRDNGELHWWYGGRADTKAGAGYRQVYWEGQSYRAHRVVWALHNGDTELEIDHKNRERSDNRIANLRAVNRSTNRLNTEASMEKRLGVRYWRPQKPRSSTNRTTE